MTNDSGAWLRAVRASQDQLSALVQGLTPEQLEGPSGCAEWTVAQVLSHLGSQAEIFGLFLDAGLAGQDPPGREAFGPIWDRWNAKSPAEQAADSLAANEAFVGRIEGLDAAQLEGLHLAMFGMDVDAQRFLRMRLSEHALHTWDVGVAVAPGALVAPYAVDLLIDGLGEMAARSGQPAAAPLTVAVTTTEPERRFTILADGVRIETAPPAGAPDATVVLPGEAFVRLVYGRLDDEHPAHGEVRADGVTLADLEALFPGF